MSCLLWQAFFVHWACKCYFSDDLGPLDKMTEVFQFSLWGNINTDWTVQDCKCCTCCAYVCIQAHSRLSVTPASTLQGILFSDKCVFYLKVSFHSVNNSINLLVIAQSYIIRQAGKTKTLSFACHRYAELYGKIALDTKKETITKNRCSVICKIVVSRCIILEKHRNS